MSTTLYSPAQPVLRHALRCLVRQFWFLPLCTAALAGYAVSYPLFAYRVPEFHLLWNPAATGVNVLSYSGGIGAALCPLALLTALCLFHFLFRPQGVTAYFSLGLRRGQLFFLRYLFGAGCLAIGLLLPLGANFILNVVNKGFSLLLLGTWLYVFCGLLTTMLVPYTVCVLVCCLTGTLAEGLGHTLVLLAAPLLLAWSADVLLRVYLPGSPFHVHRFFHINMSELAPGRPYPSLYEGVKPYTPLYFMDTAADAANVKTSAPDFDPAVHRPDWLPVLVWAALTAVLLLLAWRVFRKRRGELADFAGRCRPLGIVAGIVLGLLAFALVSQYTPLPAMLTLPLAALAFAVVVILAGLLVFWGFRRLKPALPAFAGGLGVVAAAVVVCLTGAFGYSSRVPAIDDIVSAEMKYVGDTNLVGESNNNQPPVLRFTSRRDLEIITRLHQALIDAGRPVVTRRLADPYGNTAIPVEPIYVSYTLSSGRTLLRVYDTTTLDALGKLLELYETDAVIAQREALLDLRLREEVWTCSLTDPCENSQFSTPFALTAAARIELLQCLKEDLRAMSFEEYYRPSSDAKAQLRYEMPGNHHILDETNLGTTGVLFLTDAYTRTLALLEREGVALPDTGLSTVHTVSFAKLKPFYRYPEKYTFTQIQATFYSNLHKPVITFDSVSIPIEYLPTLLPALRSNTFAGEPVYALALTLPPDPRSLAMPLEAADYEGETVVRYLPAASLNTLPEALQALIRQAPVTDIS